ncbi:MAG: neutral/alkaline non-lysosomal ceramidase N-terminal domain-containing protein [Planctomycetota bacterium]|nr:neutral/alkaline non-lysosomal ceramidase N-terminal domain-containing protein [Planctomycetota bacterium]
MLRFAKTGSIQARVLILSVVCIAFVVPGLPEANSRLSASDATETRKPKTRRYTIEKHCGMPVYVEARTLPELPKRDSQINDAGAPAGRRLLAGAARVDITPAGSVIMRGFGRRKSTGIHDRLYVRALVLDNGNEKLALISWDKLHINGFKKIAQVRSEINKRTGIPEENILIGCTHTHSGCEGPFIRASIEAAGEAWKNRKRARIGIGSKMIYGIGTNRRTPRGAWLRDGYPSQDVVMDNECGVIRIEDEQRNIIAVVANYSCHPTVLGGENTLLSGDFVGIGMLEIEKRLGKGAVALFLQGCAGDTGTQTFRTGRTIPEAERLGKKFADEALGILEHIDVSRWVRLAGKTRMIGLPQKNFEQTKRRTVPRLIKGRTSIPNEIQALIVGDAMLLNVGSMEAYVEIGLAIKEASPFKRTFVLAYANGPWLGYLPSPRGYAIQDPDARSTHFSPDAPRVLVEESLKLAREMKADTD